MIRIALMLVFAGIISPGLTQTLSTFDGLTPSAQNQTFRIPCTHTYQVLVSQGQLLSTGTNLPAGADFAACFLSDANTGVLTVNHENNPGNITLHEIRFDTIQNLWNTGNSRMVNYNGVVGTIRPCSGGISPWGTLFAAEETAVNTDANVDGYIDHGWIYEVNVNTGLLMDYDSNGIREKNWALGRMVHENICFGNDSLVAYFGADMTSSGYLFKFIAYQKGNFGSGNLYVLKKGSLLDSTGVWVMVPNSTQPERNNVIAFCNSIGATNFDRIEDVELGPDGKIYFAATTTGRIYRLTDNDTTISQFEIYVNNQIYPIQTPSGIMNFSWTAGTDNLAFDPEGNLWALRDGGGGYILVVGSSHTSSNPDIRIFGQAPSGAEPTGINFSPDGRFIFLSIQHPLASNTLVNYDAGGSAVIFNKAITLVVSRKEFLGNSVDAIISGIPTNVCINDLPLPIEVNAYSGVISGAGVINDTLFPLQAGSGSHQVVYQYNDSSGCVLNAFHHYEIHPNPDIFISTSPNYCYYDSVFTITGNYPGIFYNGLNSLGTGEFNPIQLGVGIHSIVAETTNEFGCMDSDTVNVIVNDPVYPQILGAEEIYCNNGIDDTLVLIPSSSQLVQEQGVNGLIFSPSGTTLSNFVLEAYYTDTLGCTYSATDTVAIVEPILNFISGIPPTVCQNGDTLFPDLVPSGGILSGPGVSGEFISPLSMPVGLNEIFYSTIDSNGCNYISTQSLIIITPFEVFAGTDDTICSEGNHVLWGFPDGGTWSGNFCSPDGTVFTDSLSTGLYAYTYTYLDPNNCSNTDTLNLFIENCTGLHEEDLLGFSLFPNPGNGTILIDKFVPVHEVSCIDVLGRKVSFLIQTSDTTSIMLGSEVPDGIYFIIIHKQVFKYLLLR